MLRFRTAGRFGPSSNGQNPRSDQELVSGLRRYREFQVTEIARLHKRLRNAMRSIILRLVVAAMCAVTAAECAEVCVWQGAVLSTAQPTLFDAISVSGADYMVFALAAMAAVMLTILGAIALRSAFTFRKTIWQELLNAVLSERYVQDLIDDLDNPTPQSTGEAAAEHIE